MAKKIIYNGYYPTGEIKEEIDSGLHNFYGNLIASRIGEKCYFLHPDHSSTYWCEISEELFKLFKKEFGNCEFEEIIIEK